MSTCLLVQFVLYVAEERQKHECMKENKLYFRWHKFFISITSQEISLRERNFLSHKNDFPTHCPHFPQFKIICIFIMLGNVQNKRLSDFHYALMTVRIKLREKENKFDFKLQRSHVSKAPNRLNLGKFLEKICATSPSQNFLLKVYILNDLRAIFNL